MPNVSSRLEAVALQAQQRMLRESTVTVTDGPSPNAV